MCKITEQVRKTAKRQEVVQAAANFGVAAKDLAHLVIGGKGLNPAETRALQAKVPAKKLQQVRRALA